MDQISRPTPGVKDHFKATLKSFELDESYVLDIPLSNSAHSTVSPSDHMIQTIPFPRTLRSVLEHSPMGHLLPRLQARHSHTPGLTRTLKNLINRIQLKYPDIFPPNDPLPLNHLDIPPVRPPLLQQLISSPHIFAKRMKLMANGRYSSTPPAYNTRARDQVDRPITSELFVQSYSMISKLHLDSYSMSTHLHFLNRTLWSKNKHFKSLKTDSNTCDRCHVISNSEHHLADCTFPTAFFNIFRDFTRSSDRFVRVRIPDTTSFLFLIPEANSNHVHNLQLFQICVRIRAAAMYMWTKDRFADWRNLAFVAKLISTINDLQTYLKFTHQRRDMVDAFLQFLHINPVNLALDF